MPAVDERIGAAVAEDSTTAEWEGTDDWFPGSDPGDAENWEIHRVRCPECDRPIALLGDEERLPQHALLPTAWSPFSSDVCDGSGRGVADAVRLDGEPRDGASELAALLRLPAELDWRRQPFSHAG
ncbi:hypothetical protein [Phaeacidiphilus oryzae]|jgi:hypothetical protein|uniref:hypothetical protein n=1 Tax=Phaeacidiphilus oryzae TaxID=348818 RepID=UPI00068986E3|nr:hypothetical protein [Phaeacidiphilus oryzae]